MPTMAPTPRFTSSAALGETHLETLSDAGAVPAGSTCTHLPRVPGSIRGARQVTLHSGRALHGAPVPMAVAALERLGYAARNYRGSWHEWSRSALPIEA